MSGWFSPLLFMLAKCTENELRRQIEFLKAENGMLRKRVPKQRIFLDDDERDRLIKLGNAIGPSVTKLITIVHSRTYRRWIQQKREGKKPAKRMGRPRTLESIRELVVRLARETGWGYSRIVGELKKLRIHSVSRTNVKNILAEAGLKPGPKRNQGTWDEFLKIHAETLWQVDFFSNTVITPTGLRQAFVLAFIHVGSRRVFCSHCTFKPNATWMVAQAESMSEQARDANLPMKYLIRDRDGKYSREFDEVFEKADVSIEPTAPRAPNQNAYIERWIGSLRRECLSRFVVFGKRHLDYIVNEYLSFYNELRPHQSLENRPLQGEWSKVDEPPGDELQIVCHQRLSGVLKHYERLAA